MLWINCPILQPCSAPGQTPNIPLCPTLPTHVSILIDNDDIDAGFFNLVEGRYDAAKLILNLTLLIKHIFRQ
jgi:hypothetical protein